MDDVLMILFRVTGWTFALSILYLGFLTLRTSSMWKWPLRYMALYFCFIPPLEIIASLLSLTGRDNTQINFLYVIVEFSLYIGYLNALIRTPLVSRISVGLVALFIVFQIYEAVYESVHLKYDTLGMIISGLVVMLYSLWALSQMFRRNIGESLKRSPHLWFATTILLMNFFGLITSILASVTYEAMSNNTFYVIYDCYNLLVTILLFGYYRAIRLLDGPKSI